MLQTQLVNPNLNVRKLTGIIAHTNHYGVDFAQRRITYYAYFIIRAVAVVWGEHFWIWRCSLALAFIPLALERCEFSQINVKHILFRPYLPPWSCWVTVVLSLGRQFQRYFVLVKIALIVWAETYKKRSLVILERFVFKQSVGMNKHLDMLVLAKVKILVLIHSARITTGKVFYHHLQSLFILLEELWLVGVDYTGYTWRKNIIYRFLLIVFLQIHCCHVHCSTNRRSRTGV